MKKYRVLKSSQKFFLALVWFFDTIFRYSKKYHNNKESFDDFKVLTKKEGQIIYKPSEFLDCKVAYLNENMLVCCRREFLSILYKIARFFSPVYLLCHQNIQVQFHSFWVLVFSVLIQKLVVRLLI